MHNGEDQKASEGAFILRLPDELLDNIICKAAYLPENSPSMRSWHYTNVELYGTLATLCLVCQRLNRLAMPYLYADPMIYCYKPLHSQPKQATRLIHRSCRENPSLWPLCRRLIIHYEDRDVVDRENRKNPYLYVAMDSVTWFTAAKSLVIMGLGRDERAWILLRSALEHITGLTLLSLRSHIGYNISIPQVVEILSDFKLQDIRTLHLEGISIGGDALSWRKLQEKAGTARFTELELLSFLQTPDVLRDLVRWPAHLEKFALEHTYGSCYSVLGLYTDWSLATLQPILSIHKSTLRSISIRCINVGGLDGFDLREFENLEELSLSYQSTKHTADIHLIPNLLAPQLRVFHWDLTLEDQQCNESLGFFEQKEEDWLRTLALTAVTRGCPMRRIEITFTPLYTYYFAGVYPWDRMDALGRELHPHGVQVYYNPPSTSREEYMEILNRTVAKQIKDSGTDP
ncbi:hypothetical protein BGW36DRAFT_387494 [Talaromyces proteolyticus]|uniref:F-box domain-containing protein n=1 Tax=Talaromyces proteolyticus TaxID=1131652 RepID=A0AAD4PT17_9EURO|nr:uncharacterized protein BGW36DRAFT_387494 [Talaromyces proteolyticus]KAH8692381.1 hypothetical protein BGW36DRAFT_387494 [Talaromyces proteolyticus]